MTSSVRFALNHMCAPAMSIEAFLATAASLGVDAVEIRNDLPGAAGIADVDPADVRQAAERHGLTILSINALQRFNHWTDERASEAAELIAYAEACGARALVLVPANDGTGREDGLRQSNLRNALAALKPMLDGAGLIGLVEPLGFEICSLRSKTEAVDAIEQLGAQSTFRLVHDTFHHHLAGETPIFPELTGLVHVSGVTDAGLAVSEMRDAHRVLVDDEDRLGNVCQIRALLQGGYAGPFSFEPFAPSVHALQEPTSALRESMDYITARI